MLKSENIFIFGLALFSALTSFMFVYIGVRVLSGTGLSQPQAVFAYVSAGYGLLNIYILSFAWRARVGWANPANKLIALCYFSIFAYECLKNGLNNQYELVWIAGLALVLGLNWLAVKKLVARPLPS